MKLKFDQDLFFSLNKPAAASANGAEQRPRLIKDGWKTSYDSLSSIPPPLPDPLAPSLSRANS